MIRITETPVAFLYDGRDEGTFCGPVSHDLEWMPSSEIGRARLQESYYC